MAEQIKNVNQKIDDLEAATKKYASKDTVISIGGYEFTPAKLMVAVTLASSILGGLYGSFEVYKDYIGMKKRIAEYVAPDLSVFDKRLAVVEENSQKSTDYTRDIKTDLKNDIRRTEAVTEQIERSMKQTQREMDQDLKQAQKEIRASLDRSREDLEKLKRDTDSKLERVERSVDSKIKTAIDNPLSGK